MASTRACLSVVALLCTLPSALAANLLVSHYSGNVYSLSLTTSGETGTLAIKQTLRAGGVMPSWLTLDSEAGKLYVTDESSWGSPVITELSVTPDGTLAPVVTASTTGGDLHSCLYGGSDGKGFIATAE